MLRLLFCSAALLPIAIIPWVTSDANTMDVVQAEATSYTEIVREPAMDALESCESGELPIFFHDGMVTTHSAEYIHEGLQTAADCGEYEVVIVPVLPEYADGEDRQQSQERVSELREFVRLSADDAAELRVADEARRDEVSTMYINGRAAVLRIDPTE